ncbi:MAG: DUF2064 domain-containing protein [Planctomycetes bacterium]|nr:DUF2064 domain-containing protein [Planctomycetota bacterium]MCW8136995.1 DUF2064 domain-containing protein [Planctomycetota bacterium]
MAKPQRDAGPRPAALIVNREPWTPGQGGAELAAALRDDLSELLGALRLRIEPAAEDIARVYAREPRPLLIAFSDTPALPALSVEAALDELSECHAVVGPCADGSVYLLGLAPGLDAALVAGLAQAALGPADDALAAVTDLLDDDEHEVALLPPWFRMGSEKDLSFAESVARLSLMSEEGDEDFLADRLRLWLERHAQ